MSASADIPRANAAFSASRICTEVTTGEFTVPRSLLPFFRCWRIFSSSKFCDDDDVGLLIRGRNADRGKAANQHQRSMIDWSRRCEQPAPADLRCLWQFPGQVFGGK